MVSLFFIKSKIQKYQCYLPRREPTQQQKKGWKKINKNTSSQVKFCNFFFMTLSHVKLHSLQTCYIASSYGFNPEWIIMFPEKRLWRAVSIPPLIRNDRQIIERVAISLNLTDTLIIQLLALVPAIRTNSEVLHTQPWVTNTVFKNYFKKKPEMSNKISNQSKKMPQRTQL